MTKQPPPSNVRRLLRDAERRGLINTWWTNARGKIVVVPVGDAAVQHMAPAAVPAFLAGLASGASRTGEVAGASATSTAEPQSGEELRRPPFLSGEAS